ncbi:CYFA0S19e00826g1_1 [Cyberlindnera fabianii]|uniref:CYFA0S19e00826g1_1 n=1 Tax=Cyberlindnera fabianii TaxID=36022 RepID=A0A061B6R2_CYBFA|nr:CYFA0S19e00826g1_1 [Cyberlindnera fabianii]
MTTIDHTILVLSGKGGVGKSSITLQLALQLSEHHSVGVLDLDLTGPSLPRMFGVEGNKVFQSTQGWLPVQALPNLKVMSIGFLLGDRGNSVVWRGAKKTGMVQQFLRDTNWGDHLDYLIIDTPPGTGDEHIALAEELQTVDGAVIVTTPQMVAINDVKKEINFCNKVKFDILGVVENMSGFTCPHCDDCTDVFSSGGGEKLCSELGITLLGKVPIDPAFVDIVESQTISTKYNETKMHNVFKPIAEQVLDKVEERSVEKGMQSTTL